jgi:predicted enzyme related to lactoylglutathione lyase
MARVTGIGGVFFKSTADHARLAAWYRDNLGLTLEPWGGAILKWPDDKAEDGGLTVWNVAERDTGWFSPSTASFMINYRVDDLTELLAQLRRNGIEVVKGPELAENGKFAWIVDPEGNGAELPGKCGREVAPPPSDMGAEHAHQNIARVECARVACDQELDLVGDGIGSADLELDGDATAIRSDEHGVGLGVEPVALRQARVEHRLLAGTSPVRGAAALEGGCEVEAEVAHYPPAARRDRQHLSLHHWNSNVAQVVVGCVVKLGGRVGSAGSPRGTKTTIDEVALAFGGADVLPASGVEGAVLPRAAVEA